MTSDPLPGNDSKMQTTVRLDLPMYEWLREQAFKRRVPQSAVVEEGLLIVRAFHDVYGPDADPTTVIKTFGAIVGAAADGS